MDQPANNRMAKLVQAEKQKMADSEKAEILQKPKKQSVLPKGNFFTTLYIFIRI